MAPASGEFSWAGRVVRRAAVVGSGQIGPDIALHLVKTLSPYGVPTVVLDISEAALAAGEKKLVGKIEKGRRSGAFSPERAERMRAAVEFTADYERLAGADLVIEAASEDLAVKRRIFAAVEERAAPDAVLLSNSSHLEPDRIFAGLAAPRRAAVAHYFFPAERNPVVEIAAAGPAAEEIAPWLLSFYEEIGKVPVPVRCRFGHALNPIFEGLFLAAALLVEEGLGTTKEVDFVAREALSLGIGPFTAMNLTGGNPITHEGFGEMHRRLHPWFRVPRLLEEAMAEGGPTGRVWEVPARGEEVAVPEPRRQRIAERVTAAFLGLCAWTLEEEAIAAADLDLACHLALAVRRPFSLLRSLGPAEVRRLGRDYREREPDFFDPALLRQESPDWARRPMARILSREVAVGSAAARVLTIRRPEALGALDEGLFAELGQRLDEIEEEIEGDPESVRGVVLTGFGVKAFVSGADVRMLARIESPADGERLSLVSHRLFDRIAAFPRPVVCALNAMAVGGGNELALACRARIARQGLPVLAMQPEVNLGIIPGAGATQRLPRLIGLEAAWPLLRTGRPLSADEALSLGLVRELVPGDELVDRAAELAVALAEGTAEGSAGAGPGIETGPLPLPEGFPEALPEVEIGHRSRAVDELLRRAVLEGAAGSLADGLRLEARLFGAGCALEDRRLGVRHFLENGPRGGPAPFVHR